MSDEERAIALFEALDDEEHRGHRVEQIAAAFAAVRAETIEKCAEMVDARAAWFTHARHHDTGSRAFGECIASVADTIRALAKETTNG